jgi:transcriptional regulator GlxA family with amidase domain
VKATLREFGGPIDPTGQRARVVDTDSMTKEGADKLTRLVAEAKARPPGADATAGLGRDMMTYSITIEDDGQALVLKQSDATRTQAFIELQDWIKQNAGRP